MCQVFHRLSTEEFAEREYKRHLLIFSVVPLLDAVVWWLLRASYVSADARQFVREMLIRSFVTILHRAIKSRLIKGLHLGQFPCIPSESKCDSLDSPLGDRIKVFVWTLDYRTMLGLPPLEDNPSRAESLTVR